MSATTAATYWRTLRHLRWSQLGRLALRRVAPRSSSPVRLKAPLGLRPIPGPWPFLDWQPEASRQMIASREFTFLNRTVDCRGEIPWNDRRHARLWLYHLNYFDYLNVGLTPLLSEEGQGVVADGSTTPDPSLVRRGIAPFSCLSLVTRHLSLLATTPGPSLVRRGIAPPFPKSALEEAVDIALDWLRNNRRGSEVGWEPYPLSLRIVNWLKFLARNERRLQEINAGASAAALLESLGAQVATLERRLEEDLLGNHLLKNIKALLFSGALLDSPAAARWWAIGEDLLAVQLPEQILADGGHYERSPMYHAQVLEDLAEIQLLCGATGRSLACSDLLSSKVQAMAQFLAGVLHPDGEIPFFNDSALGGARAPAALLALAGSVAGPDARADLPVTVFPDSGYAVIRNRESRSTLIFDCGPLGPDYQPGHGHCDLASYELSLRGQRVVVNPGASTYEAGPERSYERSTAAHNTVRIDGEEQAEIWASFRVGRRPQTGQIRSGAHGGFLWVSGAHHAYQRLGVVHARTILWRAPDTWIVVDHLEGSGTHQAESFVHFHPRVRVEPGGESGGGVPLRLWQVMLTQPYLLAVYGAVQPEMLPSWHAERFGSREASTTLRIAWQGRLPAGMIHLFIPLGVSLPCISADWPGKVIEIDGRRIPLVG